jgi:AcrR family transcriptional regulator
MSAPAMARSASRGTAREEAILDATMELVAEIGYDRLTMDAVATRAQASKATMYRKWPGKAELVAEGLRRHCDCDVECVPDTGSLYGDLLVTVAGMSQGIAGDDTTLFLGLLEGFRDDAVLRELFQQQVSRRTREVSDVVLARAVARGEPIKPVDGSLVFQLAFNQLFMTSLLTGTPPTQDFQRRVIDDVLLPLLTETDTHQG